MDNYHNFTNEHKEIIKKIELLKTQKDFISFFFSIEYLKYIAKLEESNDKEKMTEFEMIKNKKTSELFKN
ncbi:MAG: hypothetical protein EVJ47_05930 [Candidatus Acidulodesulfobacterium ferriphilum]|uniref:Uncharacterized protein n=1 Tax=Candidatus Acidulodesulfobacterium ferriphilum TaxID=2597223 RepID=A0A519BAF3_9DELT|nr:MAG: hypothetical protein EVJ47_05930 [Candidatus Acidulodesulfobacterium ferriphilum]